MLKKWLFLHRGSFKSISLEERKLSLAFIRNVMGELKKMDVQMKKW